MVTTRLSAGILGQLYFCSRFMALWAIIFLDQLLDPSNHHHRRQHIPGDLEICKYRYNGIEEGAT
jgi:hypothetical protein